MHRVRTALAAASLLTFTLGACSDDGPTVSAPSTPVETTSTPSASSQAPPESSSSSDTSSSTSQESTDKPVTANECLGPKPSYERVSCSSPHTYEIYFASKDDTGSSDLIKRGAWVTATCDVEAATFLGSESFGVSRLVVGPVPSEVNKDDETIACMVQEYRTSGSGLATRTSSVKGALKGEKFHQYALCAKGKASDDEIELVTCSEPHTSEAVAGRLNGKPGDPYPGDDKIHKDARAFCKPLAAKFLGGTRPDVAFAENSGGPGPWKRGQMYSGCFVEVKDGSKVTKSLKGIGDKPLSAYK